MDAERARSLLRDLLLLLSKGWWFPVIQTDPAHGIATVLGRSRHEVEALLINAGVVGENASGLSLKNNPWESFRSGEGGGASSDTLAVLPRSAGWRTPQLQT